MSWAWVSVCVTDAIQMRDYGMPARHRINLKIYVRGMHVVRHIVVCESMTVTGQTVFQLKSFTSFRHSVSLAHRICNILTLDWFSTIAGEIYWPFCVSHAAATTTQHNNQPEFLLRFTQYGTCQIDRSISIMSATIGINECISSTFVQWCLWEKALVEAETPQFLLQARRLSYGETWAAVERS